MFGKIFICVCVFFVVFILIYCKIDLDITSSDVLHNNTDIVNTDELFSEPVSSAHVSSDILPDIPDNTKDDTVYENTAIPSETKSPETSAKETTSIVTDAPQPEPDQLKTNIDSAEGEEILSEIYSIVSETGGVSVYYTDICGDCFFGIGENRKYNSASTIKAVYVQYLVESSVDVNAKIPFTHSTRSSSSGELLEDSIGKEFTVAELICYTIRSSDNQAYRLLYDTFGTNGYNEYISSVGLNGLKLYDNSEWAYCTAKELSEAMVQIYYTGLENDILTEHLKNTEYNEQIPAGTQNITAHKYGYNGENAGFHDTAIVYAQNRPYVLTVMSFLSPDDTEALELFRSITELCDRLNNILYEK